MEEFWKRKIVGTKLTNSSFVIVQSTPNRKQLTYCPSLKYIFKVSLKFFEHLTKSFFCNSSCWKKRTLWIISNQRIIVLFIIKRIYLVEYQIHIFSIRFQSYHISPVVIYCPQIWVQLLSIGHEIAGFNARQKFMLYIKIILYQLTQYTHLQLPIHYHPHLKDFRRNRQNLCWWLLVSWGGTATTTKRPNHTFKNALILYCSTLTSNNAMLIHITNTSRFQSGKQMYQLVLLIKTWYTAILLINTFQVFIIKILHLKCV